MYDLQTALNEMTSKMVARDEVRLDGAVYDPWRAAREILSLFSMTPGFRPTYSDASGKRKMVTFDYTPELDPRGAAAHRLTRAELLLIAMEMRGLSREAAQAIAWALGVTGKDYAEFAESMAEGEARSRETRQQWIDHEPAVYDLLAHDREAWLEMRAESIREHSRKSVDLHVARLVERQRGAMTPETMLILGAPEVRNAVRGEPFTAIGPLLSIDPTTDMDGDPWMMGRIELPSGGGLNFHMRTEPFSRCSILWTVGARVELRGMLRGRGNWWYIDVDEATA